MDDWKSRLVIKSMLPHYAMVGNRQEPRKLQESGTVKRRQAGDSFQHFPGMADGGYPNKIKRPCLEDVTLSMGPGAHASAPCAELQVPPLSVNPGATTMSVAGHSLLLENNPMNGSLMGSPFVVPQTAEMGLKVPTVPYYDKVNSIPSSMPAVDQELQDLLEELTKIQEPSPSDLDLEKILGSKPEEPLVLDHPPAALGPAPKPPVHMPHSEGLGSTKEFASSCSQVAGVSLHIAPSSAGISYTLPASSKQMASPSSPTAQAKSQGRATLSVAAPPPQVPQWHHAHQLKALAANKQGSASKQQGPPPSWSGLPPPGLSPPYHPVPSPHPPPPFSPQSLMVSCMSSSNLLGSSLQGSPNALLAGMATSSNAALGPVMPYVSEKLPSPALNQQSQFSPQSSILANLVSSNIKNPQGHLMSALPTSTPGPSPPYRPEKLSSPGLPQQSFTPQCSLLRSLTPTSTPLSQQQQQANSIFKPMPSGSSKTLSLIMQQGLANPSPGAPEPFTFGNTKPLSHFVSEPGPQKPPSMPATSRQPSLLHYLQQPMPTQASSATVSSTATATLQLQQHQPDHSSILLQQMIQQPQRLPRSLPSEPRQPEKQRAGLTAMTPEQRSAYIAQQMSQFQAVQELVTSKCSRTKASPQPSQPLTPSRTRLLQSNLSPGTIPLTRPPHRGTMDVTSPNPSKQPAIIISGPQCPLPPRSSQHAQSPKAAPPGVPLPGFCPSPLGSQHLSPHQLQHPSVPRMPNVFNNAPWAVVAATGTAAVSRGPAPGQVDNSILPHFDSNSTFTKAPMTMASGGPPSQKAGAALANRNFSLLGSQSLRQSPVRGPVPVLSATKSLQQGLASFSPMSPIQGVEPPSYVAAAAATAAASAIAASQSPGPSNRMGPPAELPPYDSVPQLPLNHLISPPDCSEVDFIEALLKGPSASPDEDWVCNLRLIDDILEQNAAAQNATAQNAGQPTREAGEL
ncbi:mastermind-like domain-containing protein 1 [Trichechus manatus latirostris]|uniref:Mastermind-like domain-containing protein 1 n=1 Tax=Trichechus manatus latirostris TaxID=127582 RepID=A0A2Y9QDK0_TRIMA|nr:mastermind-like domain-containing protein 1 [Trichechus manatus latirostris]